jgi:hypothetical protein
MNNDYVLNLNDEQIAELYDTFNDWFIENENIDITSNNFLTDVTGEELQDILDTYEDELVNRNIPDLILNDVESNDSLEIPDIESFDNFNGPSLDE